MKNVKNVSEWIYPVSLSYRKAWGEWESIREIVQNMMDTKTEYKIIKNTDGLILKDFGEGLKRKHLILGYTNKTKTDRGKFGEGLKFALLVLKRLGYNITVKSKNLKIDVDTEIIESEKCLKLHLDESPNNVDVGTEIFIKGYEGGTYEENFIRNGNKRKVYISEEGELIEEETSKLYVKDIFVCFLKNARWSYNLPNISLSEDRNIPSESSLLNGMGNLFKTLADTDLIEQFLNAVVLGKYELNTDMGYKELSYPEAWKTAFKNCFGESAVIFTNENWEREASWQGAKVIKLPNNICSVLEGIVKTDKEYIQEKNQQEIIAISDEKLTNDELDNLFVIRKLAGRITKTVTVTVALLPDGKAMYSPPSDIIYINRKEIKNLEASLGHLVHELTHTYGLKDMTESYVLMMSVVAGKLLFPFVKDWYPENKTNEKTSGLGDLFS